MHRTTLICAVLFIFISITIFAQITKEEYAREKEELNINRDQLKNEIEDIKFEIDSMRNRIPELEQEVITTYRELYVLKYGKDIGHKVAYKQIWTGMTDEMVKDS
jgi:peptidoglycan hydrolase CwlO-like protein